MGWKKATNITFRASPHRNVSQSKRARSSEATERLANWKWGFQFRQGKWTLQLQDPRVVYFARGWHETAKNRHISDIKQTLESLERKPPKSWDRNLLKSATDVWSNTKLSSFHPQRSSCPLASTSPSNKAWCNMIYPLPMWWMWTRYVRITIWMCCFTLGGKGCCPYAPLHCELSPVTFRKTRLFSAACDPYVFGVQTLKTVADGCRLCSSRMVNLSTAQLTAMALIPAGCHGFDHRPGANGSTNDQEFLDKH